MGQRVVITATGVISALGSSLSQIAENLRQEKVCFVRSPIDSQLTVCPITNFDLKAYTGRFKNLRYLHRGAAMTVAAAVAAMENAALTSVMRSTTGLFVGSGPNLDIGGECSQIHDGHIDNAKLSALWILRFLPNTAASAISQLLGLHSDNLSIGTACSASLQALGEAFRKIKHGDLRLALAGGGDSRLSAGALLAYKKAQALSMDCNDPACASRPFDEQRSGFVPGEGGAFFLLESMDHALKRQAPIIAEIAGYGATMDGYTMTAPEPRGRWAAQAVRYALDEAGLQPAQINCICAHGTGTPMNDAIEARLIHDIFTPHQPRILALKSWIGHLAAACGAVELALCLAVTQSGFTPRIRNLDTLCHDSLNFARQTINQDLQYLLLQNFGFGGQNAALVIKLWKP